MGDPGFLHSHVALAGGHPNGSDVVRSDRVIGSRNGYSERCHSPPESAGHRDHLHHRHSHQHGCRVCGLAASRQHTAATRRCGSDRYRLGSFPGGAQAWRASSGSRVLRLSAGSCLQRVSPGATLAPGDIIATARGGFRRDERVCSPPPRAHRRYAAAKGKFYASGRIDRADCWKWHQKRKPELVGSGPSNSLLLRLFLAAQFARKSQQSAAQQHQRGRFRNLALAAGQHIEGAECFARKTVPAVAGILQKQSVHVLVVDVPGCPFITLGQHNNKILLASGDVAKIPTCRDQLAAGSSEGGQARDSPGSKQGSRKVVNAGPKLDRSAVRSQYPAQAQVDLIDSAAYRGRKLIRIFDQANEGILSADGPTEAAVVVNWISQIAEGGIGHGRQSRQTQRNYHYQRETPETFHLCSSCVLPEEQPARGTSSSLCLRIGALLHI